MKKNKRSNKKFLILFYLLFVATIFMGIGYAVIDSISLDIVGNFVGKSQEGVFISKVEYYDGNYVTPEESEIITYYQTMLNNRVVLSKLDGEDASSITYKIFLYNNSSEEQIYLGEIYEAEYNLNQNITYTIEGIQIGDKIAKNGGILEFYITFHYVNYNMPSDDDENYIDDFNILDSYLGFNFDTNNTETIETTTYSVYEQTDAVPVVINNNNNYNIQGNITYNDTILIDNITIPANTENYLISVTLDDVFSDINDDVKNYLNFNMTYPTAQIYENAVSFIKEKNDINIIGIETYLNDVLIDNSTIDYNENAVIIDNELSEENYKISYKITLENNSTIKTYKFRNITTLLNGNNESSFNTDINLSSGIFFDATSQYTFDIVYNYNEAISNNSYKQILYLEFKEIFSFGGVVDQMISFSTSGVSSTRENEYGDFKVLETEDELQGNYCTYEKCYSDNNGNLEYDEDGALILDADNPIATLDIDQSMSVENNYSIYLTVKGDTNQGGIGTINGFPATIISISEASTKYLSWVGYYKNYLHVYSYYNGSAFSNVNYYLKKQGFISFDISEFSNKKVNIQIVSNLGTSDESQYTYVYINGKLITFEDSVNTFVSGNEPVTYTFATIGDLRPGRNLKFNGIIYDLAIYNKSLSPEEVEINWQHANKTWNIEG